MGSRRSSGGEDGFEEPDEEAGGFDEWSGLHGPLRGLVEPEDDDRFPERRSRRGKARTRGKRAARGGWGGYTD